MSNKSQGPKPLTPTNTMGVTNYSNQRGNVRQGKHRRYMKNKTKQSERVVDKVAARMSKH